MERARQLFGQLRDLYNVRSKVSHGDKICADEERAAIQLVDHYAPLAAHIAWRCFRKLLDENRVGTFNNKADHEAFLDTLLFGDPETARR